MQVQRLHLYESRIINLSRPSPSAFFKMPFKRILFFFLNDFNRRESKNKKKTDSFYILNGDNGDGRTYGQHNISSGSTSSYCELK